MHAHNYAMLYRAVVILVRGPRHRPAVWRCSSFKLSQSTVVFFNCYAACARELLRNGTLSSQTVTHTIPIAVNFYTVSIAYLSNTG